MTAKDPAIPQSQLNAAVTAMFKKEFHTNKEQTLKTLAYSKNQGLHATRNGQKPNKSSKQKQEESVEKQSLFTNQ